MSEPAPHARRLEETLRANAPFLSLSAALADAVFIVADPGEVVFASDRLGDLLGWAPEEALGRPFVELFHEDDRDALSVRMEQGGPGVQWAARMRCRDGSRRWMSLGLRKPHGAEPRGTYVFARPLDTPPEITDAAVLFQQALDAANNLVVITDARREDNPIVFVNDHFLDVTGYDEDEVLGQNCRFLQVRHGERDEQPERAELRAHVDAGEAVQVLMRNYRKDGSLFWNELYVTPLFDADGALTHFIGVQNDVTERVEAQQKTARSESLLRSFFDSAPMMMGVTALAPSGEVTHRSANEAAAAFYGCASDEVVGKTEAELGYTAAESERWQRHYHEALAAERPVRFETVFPWDKDPEGEGVRNLSVVVNRIPGTDRPPLFSYIVEDVTERRRGERDRHLLKQAVENTTAAFLITERRLDRPGPRITYVNPAFTRMTGYERDDIVGKTPRVLQGPKTDRALLTRLRRQLEAEEPFQGETVNYRKDGSEYVLDWSIEPIRDAAGAVTHWVATQRDVTEQRGLEQELLETAAREQERIASDLHDGLGQVLTGVAFLAATVEQRLRDEGSAHADDLARIAAYVEDAIDQARRLAHGLHPVDVETDGLVKALARLADTVEATSGVSCSFVYDRPVLVADHHVAAHLYRIAQEAATNALRHGKAGEVAISLTAEDGAGGRAVLAVADDGAGISDEALERGGGMGLQTMRNRAQRIGGTFEVGGRTGGGTVVRCAFDPGAAAEDRPPGRG
jgi:PAS domain S-box-containing protein